MQRVSKQRQYYVRKFPIKQLHYIVGTCTPDIAYATSYLARLTNYENLLNTHDMVLHLGGAITSLTDMCDSDFAADLATRYCTGGHIIYLGCGQVVWYSIRQTITAHSTAEAEYIAIYAYYTQYTWYKNFTTRNSVYSSTPTCRNIWGDNASANNKIKLLAIGMKYSPEMVLHGIVNILQIASNENASDIMTKSVAENILSIFVTKSYGTQSSTRDDQCTGIH